MSEPSRRPRLQLILPYSQPRGALYQGGSTDGPKETRLPNYDMVAPLLADVAWDLHPGPIGPHGPGGVETREEFAIVGVQRLPIVREACESGRYDAIVMLGGGDPGFQEGREIGRRYGIPVTACANAQMHIATMLGNKFSIIDISETHNMSAYYLVVQYRFTAQCASIRNIDFPLPRPGFIDDRPLAAEQPKLQRGETSPMLEAAVTEAVAAIEEDGAEVIMLGCSAAFWLRPHLQQRLAAMGWDVPVLEGYSAAIAQAKLLTGLGVAASGLALPVDRPKKWRRKKTF
jgi:allantoin racemase